MRDLPVGADTFGGGGESSIRLIRQGDRVTAATRTRSAPVRSRSRSRRDWGCRHRRNPPLESAADPRRAHRRSSDPGSDTRRHLDAPLAPSQHRTHDELCRCRRRGAASTASAPRRFTPQTRRVNPALGQSAASSWSPASSSATKRQPKSSANCSRPSSGPLAITSSPGFS